VGVDATQQGKIEAVGLCLGQVAPLKRLAKSLQGRRSRCAGGRGGIPEGLQLRDGVGAVGGAEEEGGRGRVYLVPKLGTQARAVGRRELGEHRHGLGANEAWQSAAGSRMLGGNGVAKRNDGPWAHPPECVQSALSHRYTMSSALAVGVEFLALDSRVFEGRDQRGGGDGAGDTPESPGSRVSLTRLPGRSQCLDPGIETEHPFCRVGGTPEYHPTTNRSARAMGSLAAL